MSFLIIGGLLAFGVLALVVAIFLGLGGQPQRAAATAAPPTIPLAPFSPTTFTNNQAVGTSTHLSSSIPPSSLEEQLHEMVVELRTLHQESHDIEHRLSTLREMAERIEQSYHHRASSLSDLPTLPEV